jgi:hypothetical protein
MKLEEFVLGFAVIGKGATTTFINVSLEILKKFSNKQTAFLHYLRGQSIRLLQSTMAEIRH